MKILNIIANPKPLNKSVSRQLNEKFMSTLKQHVPDLTDDKIDLYQDPPPYLTYEMYCYYWLSVMNPEYKPTDQEKNSVRYIEQHADILKQADILALTAPMWSNSIPAILKSWFDLMFQPGITFDFSQEGFKSLLSLKKGLIFVSSGGTANQLEPQECCISLMQSLLKFAGVSDIDIVWADGQNFYEPEKSKILKEHAMKRAEKVARETAEKFVPTMK